MAAGFNGAIAKTLAVDWWVFLVRGVVAVLFGILAFVWPGITLLALVLLFGIYAIIDGIMSLTRAFSASKRRQSWIWPVLGGVVSIAAGIVTFVWPHLTALVLLFIIAAWAIVEGISEISAGIALRREISNEWVLIVGGVISVLFGALLFARPGAGALAVVWLIGFYAVVIGVQRIALAFRVRDLQRHLTAGQMPDTGGMRGMPPATA